MSMSASSCTSTRLKNAATTQGQIQARINLPEYPSDCRTKEPHAAISVGDEVRSVLKRERAALDRQNTRTDRCAAFYEDTKSRLAGK